VVAVGAVHDQHHAVFDLCEVAEGAVQAFDELREFVGAGLAHVGFVDYQDEFYFFVDVQEALDEEGV
jgi:hypothetical protein